MVLFSDDYVRFKANVSHSSSLADSPELVDEAELQEWLLQQQEVEPQIRRFFTLIKNLPLEMQTAIACRWAGTFDDVIGSRYFNPALEAHLRILEGGD